MGGQLPIHLSAIPAKTHTTAARVPSVTGTTSESVFCSESLWKLLPLHDLSGPRKESLCEPSQLGLLTGVISSSLGAGLDELDELSGPHLGTLGLQPGHGQMQWLCLSALREGCTAGYNVVCLPLSPALGQQSRRFVNPRSTWAAY